MRELLGAIILQFGPDDVVRLFTFLIPLLLSLTVHEYAHAVSAYWLGDDTASSQGRMTLNPLSHIDPVGSLMIPVIGILFNLPVFGWAKPVPVTPTAFTRKLRMKTGMLLTALAGPVSNLMLALLAASIIKIMLVSNMSLDGALPALLLATMQVNIILFLFNLIPIPPLDGSKILAGILPDSMNNIIEFLERYGSFLLIIFIIAGGSVLHKMATFAYYILELIFNLGLFHF